MTKLIVLDETIGFSNSDYLFKMDLPCLIKKAKTKKQKVSFAEYIEDQSASLFSKNINLSFASYRLCQSPINERI
ncbi:hypothetical protein D7Z54_06480 [Salibacterium salarium]|uniref:Uncharacterized protein n=1 Tax=Salibacterium salarium TaxID=284579 RepID=A0A3R9QVE5_9BACI|nr:hypothetical protein D7Z54_06480 [Salibacterium salarium]